MNCKTCRAYDAMGYGQACPCTHINGRCTTHMKNIYAIRDRVAKEYVGNQMYLLFVFRTDQQAVRYFADAILDEKSALAKHPSDYELVKLGYIEEDNLSEPHLTSHDVLTSQDVYTVIATGDAIIATQNRQDDLHTGR